MSFYISVALRRTDGINDATETGKMDVSCAVRVQRVPALCTAVHAMLECSVEITERVPFDVHAHASQSCEE